MGMFSMDHYCLPYAFVTIAEYKQTGGFQVILLLSAPNQQIL